MNKLTITAHLVVRNEDRFVWFALQSILPYVDRVIIYDTGSTDKTVEIINKINSSKIIFEEKGIASPERLTTLRNEQIQRTKTKFFFILDGDEVWPKKSIEDFIKELGKMPQEKIAAFCQTRNAVGDIYHYLPEDAGKYHLAGKYGHLNIRAYRNQGISVSGIFPLEAFIYEGRKLNDWDEKLYFIDTWYWHGTNLKRSSNDHAVINRKNEKCELGIAFKDKELPEVFAGAKFPRRSFWFLARAMVETPIRKLKRKLT